MLIWVDDRLKHFETAEDRDNWFVQQYGRKIYDRGSVGHCNAVRIGQKPYCYDHARDVRPILASWWSRNFKESASLDKAQIKERVWQCSENDLVTLHQFEIRFPANFGPYYVEIQMPAQLIRHVLEDKWGRY